VLTSVLKHMELPVTPETIGRIERPVA